MLGLGGLFLRGLLLLLCRLFLLLFDLFCLGLLFWLLFYHGFHHWLRRPDPSGPETPLARRCAGGRRLRLERRKLLRVVFGHLLFPLLLHGCPLGVPAEHGPVVEIVLLLPEGAPVRAGARVRREVRLERVPHILLLAVLEERDPPALLDHPAGHDLLRVEPEQRHVVVLLRLVGRIKPGLVHDVRVLLDAVDVVDGRVDPALPSPRVGPAAGQADDGRVEDGPAPVRVLHGLGAVGDVLVLPRVEPGAGRDERAVAPELGPVERRAAVPHEVPVPRPLPQGVDVEVQDRVMYYGHRVHFGILYVIVFSRLACFAGLARLSRFSSLTCFAGLARLSRFSSLARFTGFIRLADIRAQIVFPRLSLLGLGFTLLVFVLLLRVFPRLVLALLRIFRGVLVILDAVPPVPVRVEQRARLRGVLDHLEPQVLRREKRDADRVVGHALGLVGLYMERAAQQVCHGRAQPLCADLAHLFLVERGQRRLWHQPALVPRIVHPRLLDPRRCHAELVELRNPNVLKKITDNRD